MPHVDAMSDANTAAVAAAAASKDDIPDDNAASTAGKNRNLPESSSDEEDGNSKKRKVSFPWRKSSESSSDEEQWENPCICEYYKGDNKMCRVHKELRKFALLMKGKGAPKDWVEGEPRTPPRTTSDTSIASASNVIDLNSNKQNLAAAFECESGKEDMVDAMLKAAGVSSFDTYPRTIEHASEYAWKCYLSKYSHLKPAAAAPPNTQDASASAPSKKTALKNVVSMMKGATKKKAAAKLAKKAATKQVKHKLGRSSSAATASASAKEVIHLEGDEDEVTVALVKAPPNRTAPVWGHYRLYNRATHPGKKDVAVCYLCYVASGETKYTEIACKDSNTSGMNRHLKSRHLKAWEKMKGVGTAKFEAPKRSQALVTSAFPRKVKDKTVDQLKPEFISVCTNFVMTECQPLNVVEKPAFRRMFAVFHRDADQVTNVSSKAVRDNVLHLGKLAENAVKIELRKHKVSWTTDHWTGKDSATYQTITSHYINSDWELCSSMIDFKVFEGSTTGQLIYEDCKRVFDEYDLSLDKMKLGVTDTTASMGKFGQYLGDNGQAHAYCTDHVLQCNAVQAFEGKLQLNIIAIIEYELTRPGLIC